MLTWPVRGQPRRLSASDALYHCNHLLARPSGALSSFHTLLSFPLGGLPGEGVLARLRQYAFGLLLYHSLKMR